MNTVHKETGLKNKIGRNKTKSKGGGPKFTVSAALTALQGKIPLPDKHEDAMVFFRDIRTK